jgi:hypothetical protein
MAVAYLQTTDSKVASSTRCFHTECDHPAATCKDDAFASLLLRVLAYLCLAAAFVLASTTQQTQSLNCLIEFTCLCFAHALSLLCPCCLSLQGLRWLVGLTQQGLSHQQILC